LSLIGTLDVELGDLDLADGIGLGGVPATISFSVLTVVGWFVGTLLLDTATVHKGPCGPGAVDPSGPWRGGPVGPAVAPLLGGGAGPDHVGAAQAVAGEERWTVVKAAYLRDKALGGSEDDPMVRAVGAVGLLADRVAAVEAAITRASRR
jgi:hypothetical protein